MAFGVFIHRTDSIYDDLPAERYQFPSQYLRRVQACVSDWIIYYEPRKVALTRGYFAVAKVQGVIPDPSAPGMYVALIQAGSYLDFAHPVPFNGPDGINERGLLNQQGGISGRAQSAVRPISSTDFNRIVELGLADESISQPRVGTPTTHSVLREHQEPFHEQQEPFHDQQDRDRMSYLASRIVRDRVFRLVVLRAYDARCAVTGLRLINGGGRAEVEAAHIQPVEANGPDVVSNGIALSGTAHWMFDRGLISVSDDMRILLSRQINDADSVRAMINKSGHILYPDRLTDRPNPHYLRFHRENCFKA